MTSFIAFSYYVSVTLSSNSFSIMFGSSYLFSTLMHQFQAKYNVSSCN
jgi:hypothetical protein